MAKKPIAYKFRIREGKDGLLRMVTAFCYNDGTMREVAMINERGETDYNGLLYNAFGYFGDTDRTYTMMKWCGWDKEHNPWRKPCFSCPLPLTKKEERIILKKYPDFKYTMRKMGEYYRKSKSTVFFFLASWLENPHTEFLVEKRFSCLIGDKAFNRMTNANKKRILRTITENPEMRGYPLKYIQLMTRHGMTYDEVRDYFAVKINFEKSLTLKDFLYLKENSIFAMEFSDHIRMIERAGKDTHDEYWRHPKDFHLIHRRLITMAERIEVRHTPKKAYDSQKKAKAFYLYGKNFRNLSKNVGGYDIYVPDDIQDLRDHAKSLAQCLVACAYDKKMAEERCILVFMKKDGKSVATVELNDKLETVQFYADEHDRSKCHPTAEMKEAFRKWRMSLVAWNTSRNRKMKRRRLSA